MKHERGSEHRSVKVLVGVFVMGLVAVASLAATAMGSTTAKTISVAIVANPQMQDIASLTPSLFTAKTGIKVKYTILDEGKLRQVTTRDVGSGGKAFDAVMIGMYEAPQFGTAGLLQDLTPQAKADKAYNYNDLIPGRAQRPLGERQALRLAVLRRVVVRHVPQGRPRRRRA